MLKCCRIVLRRNTREVFKYALLESKSKFFGNVATKKICTTAYLNGKIYRNAENVYAYGVLQDICPQKPAFDQQISTRKVDSVEEFNQLLDQNWRTSNINDIVEAFKNIVDYCALNNIDVSDKRFDKLVDGLMDNVEYLSDELLYDLLFCLVKFPMTSSVDAHNYHDIWSALDDVCYSQLGKWDVDTMLKFGDIWYKLHLAALSDFIFEMIEKLSNRANRLTKDQLVKLYFFYNASRKKKIVYDTEYVLIKHIHELNVDEAAVVAMGFFKTQTKIKSPVVLNEMARKVIENKKDVHDISLTAIAKIIRYSDIINSSEMVNEIFKSFTSEIERLSNLSLLHIALLGTNLQMYDKVILKMISDKMVREISDVNKIRLKDIERLLLVLTMFGYDPKTTPDIFETSLEEMYKPERQKEIALYPGCLVSALHYLSMKEIYPSDLINQVLHPEFINDNYAKRKSIPRELLALDLSIDIESPNYVGNRLAPKIRHRAAKWLTEFVPSYDQPKRLSAADKLFLNVVDTLIEYTGHRKYLYHGHVLPHFARADIILCKNMSTSEFIEPLGLENYNLGDIQWPKKDVNLKWYAIIVVGWNSTERKSSNVLGHMKMKARQLKTVGYEPVFVIWNEFMLLNQEEKLNYIKNKF